MENRMGLVILLAAIMYGWNYWGTSIYMLDEAKNAGCAQEMMQRGDFVVPTFNNEYHDKPALQYFFMIAAYKLFGINSFSARLFSVLAGILVIAALYHFVTTILNERTAFYAALFMIGSIQMAIQFRLAVPDPYLIFFIVTGLLCFYIGYSKKDARYLYLFYGCLGFGFLAKGPIAFVLPGLIVLFFLLIRKEINWRMLLSLKIFQGIGIALLVGLPWYLVVGYQTQWNWPVYFFVTHNFDRYVNTFEGHGGFLFDVVVIVVVALLPVSIFFPQALKKAWKDRSEQPFLLFCLTVVATFCGFFLFSQTVLPSYPAPCVPFAAVVLAWFVTDMESKTKTEVQKLLVNAIVLLIITITLPFVAFIAIRQDITLQGLAHYSLYFLIAPSGAIAGLFFISSGSVKNAMYAYVASFSLLFILVATFALPEIDGRNPVSKSISLIRETKLPVAYYQRINSGYIFRYGHVIRKLNTAEDVAAFTQHGRKVMIISTKKEWDRAGVKGFKTLFEGKDLFENPVSVILTNDSTWSAKQ